MPACLPLIERVSAPTGGPLCTESTLASFDSHKYKRACGYLEVHTGAGLAFEVDEFSGLLQADSMLHLHL